MVESMAEEPTTLMSSLPDILPGKQARILLTGVNRIYSGAFQIWRGEEMLYQGSSYGMPLADPPPDQWRPVGLVSRNGYEFSIVLYVPTEAAPGEYELRLATTVGSRSGSFRVLAKTE